LPYRASATTFPAKANTIPRTNTVEENIMLPSGKLKRLKEKGEEKQGDQPVG
jgi:hypothetical protein